MKLRLWGTMYMNVLRSLHPLAPVLLVLLAGHGALFPAVSWASLVTSVLPTSRSTEVGNTATAFATIINTGTETATQCAVQPVTPVQADFHYQTTNPNTNELTGTADTPVDIAAGSLQTFIFAFTPTAFFGPIDVELSFDCANTEPAASAVGLNTFLLSASDTPVPDLVALSATPTNDGIVNVPGNTGTGIFSVAAVNVGASATLNVTAELGSSLPLTLALCETDPATGDCINPSMPTTGAVTTTIAANATPTFAVFAAGSGNVVFDPANNRIFVRYRDGNNIERGSTSVAVRTL